MSLSVRMSGVQDTFTAAYAIHTHLLNAQYFSALVVRDKGNMKHIDLDMCGETEKKSNITL